MMKRENQPQTNFLLHFVDTLIVKTTKTQKISPTLVTTENRNDITVRKDFLEQVIQKHTLPKNTLYYQFISDVDRCITRPSDESSTKFLQLYHDIKSKGILKPLLIGKFNSKILKTRYISNDKKTWKDYENITGFQLIDGAHRLAIALYLNMENIPVKIITSKSFEIPDYTEFIKLKSKEYLKNISENFGKYKENCS